jgi:hypothetical protein
MSNYDNASASRTARNSVAIMIAALVVFSAFAIAQSNLLQWPLATELQNLSGNQNNGQTNPTSNTNSDSSILVSAYAYIPSAIPQNAPLVFEEFPIVRASVKVFQNVSSAGINPASPHGKVSLKGVLIRSDSTDVFGQVSFVLPSGSYFVSMTSQFGNLSVRVPTEPHNTTELDISINDSSYAATYFEIQNQASPGLLLPWESTYLRINSNPVPNVKVNESVYLKFSFTNSTSPTVTTCSGAFCTFNSTIFFLQAKSAKLTSVFASPSQGTMWMQVQTNLDVNITNISGIDVLVSSTAYSLKQYPMTNQTIANTTTTSISTFNSTG